MGKSWKQNAKNDKWRKQKQQKSKKQKGGRPWSINEPGEPWEKNGYSPFEDTPQLHESFS